MVPYENLQVVILYVAKQGLPRAYAEIGPISIEALLYASLQVV